MHLIFFYRDQITPCYQRLELLWKNNAWKSNAQMSAMAILQHEQSWYGERISGLSSCEKACTSYWFLSCNYWNKLSGKILKFHNRNGFLQGRGGYNGFSPQTLPNVKERGTAHIANVRENYQVKVQNFKFTIKIIKLVSCRGKKGILVSHQILFQILEKILR